MKHTSVRLGLAAVLAASLAGCAMATPATVGRIGDVEIPAGLYLLTQYEAYNTTVPLVELEEGQSSGDVGTVLAAQATGTIGGEEVTATGEEYVRQLTLHDLKHYAAVETMFNELGGVMSEEELASVDASTDSLWESNSDQYQANGIGKEALRAHLLSESKEELLLRLQYGEDGVEPVDEADYTRFIQDECYYIDSIELPLFDYSTYAFADEEQQKQLQQIAEDCVDALQKDLPLADSDTPASVSSKMTLYGQSYLQQALEVMGAQMEDTDVAYYINSSLYLPEELSYYGDSEGGNTLTDALDEADGDWTWVDTGLSMLVARRTDPLRLYDTQELASGRDLLSAMKADDLDALLQERGDQLEQALDEAALRTYKAGNIKNDA